MVVKKRSLFHLRNQKGQSEIAMVLIGLAIILGFAAYLPKLQKNTERRLQYRELRQIFRVISNNIAAHISNNPAWVITESKDINSDVADPTHVNTKGLSCLGSGSGCAAENGQTDGYIVLYDMTQNPYVNPFWDSRNESGPYSTDAMTAPYDMDTGTPGLKQGFTFTGEVCYTFHPDPAVGNDDCPIRAVTRWAPSCSLVVCLDPNIVVFVEFQFHPSRRFKDIPVNAENYDFQVDRKTVESSITDFNCDKVYPVDADLNGIPDSYTYSFLVPATVETILVKAWGAGGAGAGGSIIQDNDNDFNAPMGGKGEDGAGPVPPAPKLDGTSYVFSAGGGGGGAAYSTGKISVIAGETISIQIGQGGAPKDASIFGNVIAGNGGNTRVIAPTKTITALGGRGGVRCRYDVNTATCNGITGNGLGGAGGGGSSSDFVVVAGKAGSSYNTIFNYHYDLEKAPSENRYRNDYFYVTFGGPGGDAGFGGGEGGTSNHQNDGRPAGFPGGGGSGRQGNFGQPGADGMVVLCF